MSVNITSQKEIPSLIGNSGKFLTNNGTDVSWTAPAGNATNEVAGLLLGKTTSADAVTHLGASSGGLASMGVAIGYGAMFNSQSSASGSTAVGVSALGDNFLSGTNNSALGYWALKNMTNGYRNTGIGAQAGASITTGFMNTAVGNEAFNAANGHSNSALGYYALRGCDGNYNTAIGREAGSSMAAGSNNSMIGYNAQAVGPGSSNSITLGNSSITSLRCATTSISGLSDERDKKDIVDLPVGLSFINGLRPVNFIWNMRPDLDEEGNVVSTGKVDIPDMGFIAQDFVAAEDATGLAEHLQLTLRDNPEKLEATYGRLVPILVKAIQELTARVEALEAK